MSTMPGFKPLSLDELFALDLPPLEYVVDGMLPLGHACLLTAREKAGKGLLAIDLCASVALGEPFLGRATMQGPAIYCAAEEHIRDVRDRIAARVGVRRDAPLYVLQLDGSNGDRLNLADVDSMQRLWNMVIEQDPLLVVLDVLRELHDRTEDLSDEMGPLLRPVRQLAHELHTTPLVTHHHRKSGGSRGSTAIKAAFDVEWSLDRKDSDDGPPAGLLQVEGRHGPRVAERIQFGEGGRWELATAPIADPSARDRILNHLATAKDALTAEEIAVETSLQLHTVQNEMSRLVNLDPCPIDWTGSGRRGDPRRFRSRVDRMELDYSQPRAPLGELSIGNNPGFVPIVPLNRVGSNGNNRSCAHKQPHGLELGLGALDAEVQSAPVVGGLTSPVLDEPEYFRDLPVPVEPVDLEPYDMAPDEVPMV